MHIMGCALCCVVQLLAECREWSDMELYRANAGDHSCEYIDTL